MNPFQFSSDDSSPPYANPVRVQWFPRRRKWKWPADYRSFVCYVSAFAILTALLNITRAILHPRSRSLLQNVLVGPIFYSAMASVSAIALWAIWKDKAWARGWAVAASSIHVLAFLRQFVIPVRPTWDHYLSSLIVAAIGVVAFSWRDKQVDNSEFESA
jgi:hypothetical protein